MRPYNIEQYCQGSYYVIAQTPELNSEIRVVQMKSTLVSNATNDMYSSVSTVPRGPVHR